MGDLRGRDIELKCCACEHTYEANLARGVHAYRHQLCEPCRIRGFTLDRGDHPGAATVLRRDGKYVRDLDREIAKDVDQTTRRDGGANE